MSSDPGGGWIDFLKSWWPALATSTTPFALATWFFTRRDAATERKGKARENEAEREAAERVRQDAVDAAQIGRYQAEIDRLYARVSEVEMVATKARRDADRGWWLGRHWHAKYSDLVGDAKQYRHDVGNKVAALRGTPDDMPVIDLPARVPGLEEPNGKHL